MKWFNIYLKKGSFIKLQADKMVIYDNRSLLMRNGEVLASIPISILVTETAPPIDL
ncbi:hypothetical protein [Apibacter muscae]|uniref:hypothetical protein n=1 Tax=Apibacter muscae TaxID=2509004 RepID=UPI00162A6D87|nr:hypothetical protein [Apibacter muscae]